jgi:hypothetical protein
MNARNVNARGTGHASDVLSEVSTQIVDSYRGISIHRTADVNRFPVPASDKFCFVARYRPSDDAPVLSTHATLQDCREAIDALAAEAGYKNCVETSGKMTVRAEQLEALSDERFDEIKRAQKIIDGLKAFREFCLTQAVSADEIQMIMADQWPDAEALGYVAVKVAEAIEKRIQDAAGLGCEGGNAAEAS